MVESSLYETHWRFTRPFNFIRNYRNVFGSNGVRYRCIYDITITEVPFSSLNPRKTTERDVQQRQKRGGGGREGPLHCFSLAASVRWTTSGHDFCLLHTQTYVNNKNKTIFDCRTLFETGSSSFGSCVTSCSPAAYINKSHSLWTLKKRRRIRKRSVQLTSSSLNSRTAMIDVVSGKQVFSSGEFCSN